MDEDEEELASLIEDMRSGDENRLISASMMLAQFGHAAIPGLLETIESANAFSRDYSAMALGLIRPLATQALPAICKAAFDSSPNVRFAAVAAIHGMGKLTPKVMECLRAASTDSDEKTGKRALLAIKELT